MYRPCVYAYKNTAEYSVSHIVGYLKRKSSLMIFDRHANLKYKYMNRHFWCRGYLVNTVSKNSKNRRIYIKSNSRRYSGR